MCDCKAAIDERLAFSNSRIAFGFTFTGNKMNVSPPMIVLEKIDQKKRGKPPTLLATCCPFCGERYEDDTPSSPRLIRHEKRIERLREALESIAEGVWPYGTEAGTVILEMRARAQNALAADNPQTASVRGKK